MQNLHLKHHYKHKRPPQTQNNEANKQTKNNTINKHLTTKYEIINTITSQSKHKQTQSIQAKLYK